MKLKIIIFTLLLSVNLFSSDYLESFRVAEKMFDDNLFEESISEFRRVIQLAPTSFEAEKSIIYIAESFEKEGKNNKAVKYYQQLLDGYPNSTLKNKAIYKLINLYYKDKNYRKVIELSENLFKEYPKTEYAEKSIIYFLYSLYFEKKYNDTIIMSGKMIKNYPDSKFIPEVYFIQAKAFYKNSMEDKYKENIKIIKNRYKSSGIYWDSQVFLIEKTGDNSKIIIQLTKLLDNKIPRIYDEKIRFELLHYLLKEKKYQKSLEILSGIIAKFSNSDRLPEAIYYKTFIQIKLQKFTEVTDDYSKNKKFFRNSNWKTKYEILVSKAYYQINKLKICKEIINGLPTLSDSLEYQKEILLSKIMIKEGFYHQAIAKLSSLNKVFSNLNIDDEVNYQIAEIYFSNLKDYDAATRYYKLVMGNPNLFLEKISQYKIALCLEYSGKIEEAIKILYRIQTDKFPELKNKVDKKRDYLVNFVKKDTNMAIKDLIVSFAKFIDNSDKKKAKLALSDVLYYDLKDFDGASAILDSQEAFFQYKKAYILLKKMGKNYESEKNNPSLKNNILTIVENLKSNDSLSFANDIQLRLELIEKKGEINKNVVDKMEIIFSNKNLIDNNYYHELLSEYYQTQKDTVNLIRHLKLIEKNRDISFYEYFEFKTKLADIYFAKKDFQKAAETYNLSESVKIINSPKRKFKQAFSLFKIGDVNLAIDKYLEIIRNYPDFEEKDKILLILSDWYKKNGDLEKSTEFLLKVKMKNRDDSYWMKLADNYKQLQKYEDEKIAIMHILNKSIFTLKRLAELQYKTNDLNAASFTYSQLVKKAENKKMKLNFYANLAHIYFLQGKYEKSIKFYLKTIFPKKKTTIQATSIPNYEIIKDLIISYYKIENRPKAEYYEKKYKKLLKENPNVKAEVLLNRGIYYQRYNLNKSKKIFDAIVKNKKISKDIKDKAVFWRGITFINSKQPEKALIEFKAVLNSNNKELVNKTHLKLGILYFSKEKYQEALNHYSYVMENDSTGTLALEATKNYAIVCKTIEEWEKAIDAYELIISRWGDDKVKAKTRFDIAFCYYRDKKYPKAADMFEKAIPNLKDNALKAEALYWIGESYFHDEKYEEAVSNFLKVSYQYPDQIKWKKIADLRAAESYYKKNDYQKARYMFKKVVSKYGLESDVGKEAAKKLKELGN